MSRPGKPLTKKSILLQTKMAELEKGDKCSSNLLANVLDMDDEFLSGSILGENALNLSLGLNAQPKSAAWLDVDNNRWSFPSKVKRVGAIISFVCHGSKYMKNSPFLNDSLYLRF